MSASSRREAGSRFDDGSSRTRISGCIASTVATATRRRWPKERWCGGRSAYVRHPDLLERGLHPRLELVALEAEVGRAEAHVLADRAHEQLVVGVLEHDADPAPDLGDVVLGDRQPADGDAPGAGDEDAVEVQHQRGLAGAVGAEQGDALALVDVEVDAEQRLVAVGVGEREAVDVEDRSHGLVTAASCRCSRG